jgi:hypothetical protein
MIAKGKKKKVTKSAGAKGTKDKEDSQVKAEDIPF